MDVLGKARYESEKSAYISDCICKSKILISKRRPIESNQYCAIADHVNKNVTTQKELSDMQIVKVSLDFIIAIMEDK